MSRRRQAKGPRSIDVALRPLLVAVAALVPGPLWVDAMGHAVRGQEASAAAVSKGDRELGQHLSSECVTCHQTSGRFHGIAPIVGWPEDVFVEIMGEYRAGKRENAHANLGRSPRR